MADGRWTVLALLLAVLGPGAVRGGGAAPAGRQAERSASTDPFELYAAGDFTAALEGFVRRQVRHPEDPALEFDVGSVQYKLDEYGAAEKTFEQVLASDDRRLRARALYDLGNVAYRLGRLEEALSRYRQALEEDSTDGDAKFNLEFVQRELERRRQAARQQHSSPSPEAASRPGQQGSEPRGSGSGQGSGAPSPATEQRDTDRDGLPDRTEREGANPTDPRNPDTDGDGLLDGQEDSNGNGALDAGETDPNRADTDGDGVPDGVEAGGGDGNKAGNVAAAGAQPRGMTTAEAERYLQALEEGVPHRSHRQGARRRRGKDW